MDLELVALKVQRAIGRQVYLISILLVAGVLASIWLVNLVARPLGELLAYTVEAGPPAAPGRIREREAPRPRR